VVALAIVAIVLLALTLDTVVPKLSMWRREKRPAPGARHGSRPFWLSTPVPTGLSLAPNHLWIRREKSDVVRVGGDGFAAALLGGPDKVKPLARFGRIARGQALASVSRQGRTLILRSPMDGTLLETNVSLDPKDLVADPFGRGWLATLRPKHEAFAEGLRDGACLTEWLSAEWERARQVVVSSLEPSSVVGTAMADGGALQPGFFLHLSDTSCQAVQRAFLGASHDEPEALEANTEEIRA